jgi:hypothetical protein
VEPLQRSIRQATFLTRMIQMKNPRLLTSFATAIAVIGMCNADAETIEGGGGATPEALAAAGESAAAAEATRKRSAASNFLPIVRGRLPLVFVHAVRFDPVIGAMGNKDIASKFATSVGKVFDIKKGRNFGYVDASYKPSAEDLTAAQSWIDQVGAENAKGMSAVGDKAVMVQVLEQYKAGGLATAEDIAKLAAARGATRAVKAEKPATTGVLAAKAETVQGAAAGTADDLLS